MSGLSRLWAKLRQFEINSLVVFVFGLGAVVMFFVAPLTAQTANLIDEMPRPDAAELETLPPGTQVVISGVLEGNTTFDGDMVAFRRMVLMPAASPRQEEVEEAGGQPMAWIDGGVFLPPLTVAVADGLITLVPGEDILMSGTLIEAVLQPDGTPAEGETLPLGTRHYQGLRNGDAITAVGVRTTAGQVAVTRIYGGTLQQMMAEYRRPQRTWQVIGAALMVIGVISGVLTARRPEEILFDQAPVAYEDPSVFPWERDLH
ncbi:MAG: hypothetical protein Kow00124_05440 [Anaerolineae bacterium]